MTCQQCMKQDVYVNDNKVCIKAFALNFIDAKYSNCALVHEYKPNLQVGCIQNRITVINVQMTCQQYIIQDVYENGNKVCIKAFALNFIDAKLF